MNNYLIKKIATSISPILFYSGIGLITKPIYGGKGHILMFHRVVEKLGDDRVHNHESLEITVEHLESILKYFKDKGYSCISLDELYDSFTRNNLPDKFVVYTFDDGYKDNYKLALPVFEKYNAPFTVYITTSFPDYTAVLWWYALEDLLKTRDTIEVNLPNFCQKIDCSWQREKEIMFNTLRDKINELNLNEILAFFKQFRIDVTSYVKTLALSWDDIIELDKNSLVTIGAHTTNHLALRSLSDVECYAEMIESKKELEKRLQKEINHFSYPFGKREHADEREFLYAKKIGYKTCTTTRLANVFMEHRNALVSLPRISINSLSKILDVKLQTTGVFPMIRNKFKRIVTN